MKILLVSPYFIDSYKNNISMGSAVKLAFSLSRVAEVTVLTSGRKLGKEVFNKNLTVLSSRGFLIPDPINYMISISLLIRFWRLVKEIKPEIVIVSKYMFFSSFVIPIAKLLRVPVITVTDTFPGINWFSVSKFASAIMWLYARLIGIPLLKVSDKVVLLYEGLEPIAQKYGLKHVTIHNGVDSKYFEKLDIPTDIKKNKNEFWVGFVGRPESAKGYDQVLKMAKYLTKYKDMKIVLVGGKSEYKEEENKIFLGFRKDIMNIYQLFDVLVLPSHAEGLPNVAMEAMSQGVPVIGNRVGGVERLIKNMVNGVLVNPGNVEEMEKAILRLKQKNRLRKELGVNAKQTIFNDFNWDKIVKDYFSLINKIICAE